MRRLAVVVFIAESILACEETTPQPKPPLRSFTTTVPPTSNAPLAVEPVAAGVYTLTARHSSKCLDVPAGVLLLQQSHCRDGRTQRWVFTTQPDGTSTIANQETGKCLDVEPESSNDGVRVPQNTCDGGPNQRFVVRAQQDGYATITANNNGKCLDVWRGSTEGGVQVAQFHCHGGPNQQWKLVKVE